MIKYFAKTFFKIFLPFMAVFAVYIFASYNTSVKNAELSYKDILKTYWFLTSEYKSDNMEETLAFFKKLGSSRDIRITLIDMQGKVVFDSSVDDNKITSLENHLTRKEVENASKGQEYYDIRKSATTGRYSIYYAAPYNDKYILRLVSDGNIFHNIYNKAKSDIILFLIIFSCFLFIVSLYLTYWLTLPVNAISSVAKAISENKTDFIMPKISDNVMDEAASLIYNINRQLLHEKETLDVERHILSSIINHIDEAVILFNSDNVIVKSNFQAYHFFSSSVKEGINPVTESVDYEKAVFFDNILHQEKGTIKSILGNNVFEIYVRNMHKYRLVVIRDITASADYDDFKAELTANIAHEIKTPIAIIMGAAETLLADDKMPKELSKKFLTKIYTGSSRLNNIINQTLELYRVENTGVSIEEKADISQIISNIIIHDTNKAVRYNNKTGREYNIDSYHVEMILTNLINNAVKYSGGDIIDVSIYEENSALFIEVADMGPQIAEKERNRIFERFYTVSKSRKNSGFGLGLSIVKHIAFMYGGSAKVYPNNNKGNTFRIKLYERK